MIQFKLLSLKDHDKFIEYRTKFFNSESVDHSVPAKQHEENFQFLLTKNPYTEAYMLEFNEEIVGYAQISFEYSMEVSGMVVWIEELFVDEKYRNNKIGQTFLKFVLQKYDAKRFRLEVTDVNEKAKKLYQKLGFKFLNYEQMIIDN